jgi:MYXO-CTERM domain-containing protein
MARSVQSRRAARCFVAIAAAGASATVSAEAAANPPAPTNWPDPPQQAPKSGAKAKSIQKHDSGCFVHYDDGGNGKIDCPESLAKEPPGESIEKSDDGTCHYMMTISWSGGSSGATPCPEALAGGATTAPTSTGGGGNGAGNGGGGNGGGGAPPSIKPAEQSGCGACSTSNTSTDASPFALAAAASTVALFARRRRSSP